MSLETTTRTRPASNSSGLRRLVAVGIAFVVSAALMVAATVTPAAAARSIAGPAGYTCGRGIIAVSPPRVWASNRTEQVTWINAVQRWDARRRVWYLYSTFINYGSFNTFGQNLTSWSMGNTTTGGRYINSRLNLPVSHQGYYRVAASVGGNQNTVSWTAFVAGPAAYCWMP